MGATIHHTLFLAKERPLANRAADNTFQVQMLCMDDIGNGQREAWRLLWGGPEAEAWWNANRDQLQPGQPLTVKATRIRAMQGGRAPEIHARVLELQLAPRRAANTAPANHPFINPRPAVA